MGIAEEKDAELRKLCLGTDSKEMEMFERIHGAYQIVL
jgi:hypothetical protein